MEQIGFYDVHEQLGRGGMGAVFRAVDRRTGQEVALKLLGAQDERSRRRLVLEARALGRLRHRNVVSLLDAGEDRGRPWLALELVRGRSLQERLDREGRLAPREAARLLQSLAAGLAHAHREGVLHRDLKPANVLLPADGGEAKLTDFGLAGFEFELSQSRLTKSGTLMGSPGYWSPEQASGKTSTIGPATDVYGLGGLLYAALTGRAPIEGESLAEILVATESQRPAAPGVDPVLDAVALRCLEKRPEARYASVDAVARELARYLAGRSARRWGGRRLHAVVTALAVGAGGLAWVLSAPPAPSAPEGRPAGVTTVTAPEPTPPLVTPPTRPAEAPTAGGPERLPVGVRLGERPGEYVNDKDGSLLVWVPAGSFRMGSDTGRPDEAPVHEVRLTRGYFLGKHEVTWDQYRAFCRARGRATPSSVIQYRGRFEATEQHPVFGVSWDDAQAYCLWAGLRLPTEAEWEYAARGDDGRAFPWGDEEPGTTRCNLGSVEGTEGDTSRDVRDGRDGHLFTAPVGVFPAGTSPAGALDMAGNVWEWCQDWYGSYSAGSEVDPRGSQSGEQRVIRGGSWDFDASYCRGADRYGLSASDRVRGVGFRVALSSLAAVTPPTRPAETPTARRPERLPAGVRQGERPGEYVSEKDRSVLVWVPAGSFRRGSDTGRSNEVPVHEVRLTRGYFVGKYEVTWRQYRAFCQARGLAAPSNVIEYRGRFEATEQHPVFNVSWDDAQAYCEWAGLRLPAEAEWEYAARGDDGRTYPWGDEEPGTTRCNLGSGDGTDRDRLRDARDGRDGHRFTAPVGVFPAGTSPFGALDMAGNVWEWCQDRYGSYSAGAVVDPRGPQSGKDHVLRGGSWLNDASYCRGAFRGGSAPSDRVTLIGFRVALSSED